VSYSPALNWFIALLLPLTLAWKLTVGPDASNDLKLRIAEFLVERQFEVVETEQIIQDMPILRATQGACRMLVSRTSNYNWDRQKISKFASAGDDVFMVFRGMVYTDQPTLRTSFSHLWSRFLRPLGLVHHTTPVIAVIAPAICDAEKLHWDELRERGVL
jgi:hypothetical protein